MLIKQCNILKLEAQSMGKASRKLKKKQQQEEAVGRQAEAKEIEQKLLAATVYVASAPANFSLSVLRPFTTGIAQSSARKSA